MQIVQIQITLCLEVTETSCTYYLLLTYRYNLK